MTQAGIALTEQQNSPAVALRGRQSCGYLTGLSLVIGRYNQKILKLFSAVPVR